MSADLATEGLGPGPGESSCWCGEPSRGWIAEQEGVPMHRCRECSHNHCQHVNIARRCEFGLCVREAELELIITGELTLRVCGLHVAPVLGWGVPEPAEPRIRYLAA